MVLGSCVIFGPTGRTPIKPKSLSITGEQDGFLVTFTVRQVFRHSDPSSVEVSYIIPTNCKMCVSDTTFTVGSEVIKPLLQEKHSAESIFVQALDEHRTALFGRNLANGLTEFKLGNIPPGVDCEVAVRVCFTCANTGEQTQTFKFPLDVCTPSGSPNCVTALLDGPFSFSLRHMRRSAVRRITSNASGAYDSAEGVYTISERPSAASLIVTTELNSALASEAVISGRSVAITILPTTADECRSGREFIFVVDCSGSMSGIRMAHARECLQLFIRSLPPGSVFDVVRFGSGFEHLFDAPAAYEEREVRQAMVLAANMQANLGGTELLAPLSDVFQRSPLGGAPRQVFVLTDGQVGNADAVLDLARRRAHENRCFTLGIGADADAGIVEGLARATGGQFAFVQASDEIADRLIPQLECALRPALRNVRVDLGGADGAEFAPFPLPALSLGVATTVFAHAAAELTDVASVLVSGELGGVSVDLAIPARPGMLPEERVAALFAFTAIEALEGELRGGRAQREVRASLIRLSTTYGILCSQTAFVGVTESVYRPEPAKRVDVRQPEQRGSSREDEWAERIRQNMREAQDMMSRNLSQPMSRGGSSDDCIVEHAAEFRRAARESGGVFSSFVSKVKSLFARPEREAASGAEYGDSAPRVSRPPPPPASPRPATASRPPPPAACSPPCASAAQPAGGAATLSQPHDLMMRIVALQNLDGSWSDIDTLVSLSGKGSDVFDALRNDIGSAFATTLAVAMLRHRCAARESAWNLVAKKALSWLSGRLGDTASAELQITRVISVL